MELAPAEKLPMLTLLFEICEVLVLMLNMFCETELRITDILALLF